MKTATSVFFLLALAAGAVQASELGTVHGTIADAWDKQRVVHASLTLQSAGYLARAVSDKRGSFTLFGVPPDSYVMTLQAEGYEPVVFRVCVTGGDAENLPLLVSRNSSSLMYAHDQNVANRALLQRTTDEYTVGRCGG
jgi:hypothetical protein